MIILFVIPTPRKKRIHMRLILLAGLLAADDAKRSQVTLRQGAMRESRLKVTGFAAQRKKIDEVHSKVQGSHGAIYQQRAILICPVQ